MIAIWITADRRQLPIGVMERDHILKTMALLRRGKAWRTCNGMSRSEWLMIFASELTRRDRMEK